MKMRNIILILTVLLLCACSSVRNIMIPTGENIKEIAIHNAILDFSTNTRLFREDSIFSVSFSDTLFTFAVRQIDELSSAFELDRIFDEIVTVGIVAHYICKECEEDGLKFSDRFFYLSGITGVGSKGFLPSRHIIKDGKLFYWWDNNYPMTEEMLAILWEFDLLFDNTDRLIPFPSFSTGAQKGAHYYFCRNNLSRFRRVITNIGLGYYRPPRLRCR